MSDNGGFSAAERAILAARTAMLARREHVEIGASSETPAVFFRVGRQACCALARCVRSATRLDDLVPVPHGGRNVAGAIVRNGSAIAVFHLAALVGDRIARLPETAHGLLLGDATDELALAVDLIDGFGGLVVADLREPPDDVRSRWATAVTANGEVVLDFEALRQSPLLWIDANLLRTE